MSRKKNAFEERTIKIFADLKNEVKNTLSPQLLPIYEKNVLIAYLRVVSIHSLKNPQEIKNLATWRKIHEQWFPAQFKVTIEGTKKWLEEQVLNQKDRILFMLETPWGVPFGHMGLYRFDYKSQSCEVDNVIRGSKDIPGGMTFALQKLIAWAFSVLKVKTLYLKVFLDNKRAIQLYKRCGFVEARTIPMKKKMQKGNIAWVEETIIQKKKAQRYFLVMKLERHQ